MTTKLPTTGPTAALRITGEVTANTRELGRLVSDWDMQAIRETIELLHVQLAMLDNALPRPTAEHAHCLVCNEVQR